MATATVIVARKFGGIIGRRQKWQVLIDGAEAGTIAVDQTVELPAGPGQHTLRLKASGRFTSQERSFELAEGEEIRFSCHSQFLWPFMLASLVKPDFWIRLNRDLRQTVQSSWVSGTPTRRP